MKGKGKEREENGMKGKERKGKGREGKGRKGNLCGDIKGVVSTEAYRKATFLPYTARIPFYEEPGFIKT